MSIIFDTPEYIKHRFNPPQFIEYIEVPHDERVMTDILSSSEFTRIIGIRATHLEQRIPTYLTDLEGETNTIKIAKKEFKLGLLPYKIMRIRSCLDTVNQNKFLVEVWKLEELTYNGDI